MRSAGDLQLQTVTQGLLLFVILPATGLHGSHGRQAELGEDHFIFWNGEDLMWEEVPGCMWCQGSGCGIHVFRLQDPEPTESFAGP